MSKNKQKIPTTYGGDYRRQGTKRDKSSARHTVSNYMYKYDIEYPNCFAGGCNRQANQKLIPNPIGDNKYYVIFFCNEHMQSVINPPEDRVKNMTDEQKAKHEESKIIHHTEYKGDLPEPWDVREMKKNNQAGRTKDAVRKEIRKLIKQQLPYLENKQCENIDDCRSGKHVTFYMRPEGSEYNVSFLCQSCRSRITYEPRIIKNTESYELKELSRGHITEEELKEKQQNSEKTLQAINSILTKELKRWARIYGTPPSPLCANQGCQFNEKFKEEDIFSDSVNRVFPDGNNPLRVAIFCPICSDTQPTLKIAYGDLMQMKNANVQNVAGFTPVDTLFAHHIKQKREIQREEG